MVYVLDQHGRPLMPTTRHGKVRRLLKAGKAKVIERKPFTIQLLYSTTTYSQPLTLGVDSGYENVGVSVVSENTEVYSAECKLLTGMSERLKERSMYRKQRRSRLRYRKSRFNNRRKQEGWLAPSIQHKLDSQVRLVEKVKKILPITQTIVEVASFDIQTIKNPHIEGKQYQEGEQQSFWNLREYILHRDHHQCQNPTCRNQSPQPILQIHHIGFWKEDRSNRPSNLITLCDKCHTPKNHVPKGILYGWEPTVKSFRPETFMSIVRWKLVSLLEATATYGYLTKSKRIEQGLEKSHATDAFMIAGRHTPYRCETFMIQQVRRNNRSLEKFYDAKIVDIRTGEVVKGQELASGRRTRNREWNEENLRVFRGKKVSKGQRRIRKKRYPLQPMDTVDYQGNRYLVKGVQNKGEYIKLEGCSKPVKTNAVIPLKYGKGLQFQ